MYSYHSVSTCHTTSVANCARTIPGSRNPNELSKEPPFCWDTSDAMALNIFYLGPRCSTSAGHHAAGTKRINNIINNIIFHKYHKMRLRCCKGTLHQRLHLRSFGPIFGHFRCHLWYTWCFPGLLACPAKTDQDDSNGCETPNETPLRERIQCFPMTLSSQHADTNKITQHAQSKNTRVVQDYQVDIKGASWMQARCWSWPVAFNLQS